MDIGTLLNLEVKHEGSTKVHTYRCKIIEKNNNYLFIDYPINIVTRKTAFFQKGTRFFATYVGSDQTAYRFRTKIEAKVKLPLPALAIQYPDKEQIQRIQRREYVRIETAVDVAIQCPEGTFRPFTTVTADISGGGLSVILPKAEMLSEKAELNTCIVLHMDSGDYQYIYTRAEVIRINSINNTNRTASIKFLSINKRSQQHIIRYCFEKQREARQKELI